MKKNTLVLIFSIYLIIFGMSSFLLIAGCGTSNSGSGSGASTSGNYTLSGKVGTISASGLKTFAVNDTVTDIVAIGADNNKTLVTPNDDGSFTLSVTSGQPYVLGFFNKTGGTITLLGYLKKGEYDWDSLPIIDPVSTVTDLGTIEINTTSVEATPSINISTLISEMNMNASTATLYGEIDDSLAALTNLDLDSNGEFDFNESKNYLFQTYIGMNESGTTATGEIDSMLSGYNDEYIPIPGFFQINFTGLGGGDTRSAGISATLRAPSEIGGTVTQTTSTGATSGNEGWTLFFPSVSTPEVAPSGTYIVEMVGTTYTINNFKASSVVAMGADNNIVYPIFHLVTNEAGKITTVQYKWMKLVNGTPVDATPAEVNASINYEAGSTSSFTQNPFISFFSNANTLYSVNGSGIFAIDISASEVDISSLNISREDIHHIQAGYELTSKVICKFDLY